MSHLNEINESYFEHMCTALKYGFKLIFAGLACIIHALIPDAFVTTGSETIKNILEEIHQRKNKMSS